MLNQTLADRLDDVKQVLKEHRVRSAYAFGSVCTEEFGKRSDVDFLVSFDLRDFKGDYLDNLISMEAQLTRLLRHRIDITPAHTLKNPYFIEEVNKTKVLLYE